MNRRTNTPARMLMVLLLVSVGSALADDLDLDWWTVDGGGDTFCTGGDFELSGTVGQPDAGYMAGGDFELVGAIWAGVAEFCPGDLDGDGDTDQSDLGLLLAAWCAHEGDPNWNPDADLDGDGHIGQGDLGILLADWACGVYP